MNRNEREQAIWHDAYMLAMSQDPSPAESSGCADAAVAQFRQRYPVEPEPPEPNAPEPTWHDVPPFARDGKKHPCWVTGEEYPCVTHWSRYARPPMWVYANTEDDHLVPLNGCRVSPIHKPQEPTT
jgi:hypothetical protein